MKQIRIRRPDDFHLHLRQGEMLKAVAPYSAAAFSRALVMPNTLPPVTTPEGLKSYRDEIMAAAPGFEPLMSFKLLPKLDPGAIPALKKVGAVAGKYYPAGATTNAEDGIREPGEAYPLFEALQQAGLVLCVHAEDPDAPVFEREAAFLPHVTRIARDFPRLKIVVEHLSSKAAVEALYDLPRSVGATITAHHLAFTAEQMLGGKLDSRLFCKPIVKFDADRKALIEAATSSSGRFFFGSDSAPHSPEAKADGAAGSFTAPVALSLLAGVFEEAGKLETYEDFTSRFGAEFYGLPLNRSELIGEKSHWQVPAETGGVVPVCAGEELAWGFRDP